MKPLTNLSRLARPSSDPVIEETGPSSLSAADKLARALGWFSLALGAMEVLSPRRLTNLLGLRGKEGLVRSFGVREIAAGMLTLSIDKKVGLIARVFGDGLDLAALSPAMSRRNRKRDNASAASSAVSAIMLLDIVAVVAIISANRRSGQPRDYGDRGGLPKGIAASRGLAGKGAQGSSSHSNAP